MRRTRLLKYSVTAMRPSASTATPAGSLKAALALAPSAHAAAPLPATVLTTPSGVTRRTRLTPPSATIKLLALSMAMRMSPWNAAAVPSPSTHARAPLPASVVARQMHGGCAARPPTGHAVAGTHGAAPAAPPTQKEPAGHAATAPPEQ